MTNFAKIFAFIVYLSGIIIANGFWSTFFAIFFPPWAWYIVIEKMLIHFNFIT